MLCTVAGRLAPLVVDSDIIYVDHAAALAVYCLVYVTVYVTYIVVHFFFCTLSLSLLK